MTSTRPPILDHLAGVRQTGAGWSARCPAHEDRHASLSVGIGDDGRTLLHCHAGCTFAAVVAAAGMSDRDQFADGNGYHANGTARHQLPTASTAFTTADLAIASYERQFGPHSAKWAYHDADGDVIAWAVRWDRAEGTKEYRPVTRHDGGWRKLALPEGRTLYQLPGILSAVGDIYVCEGERAADAVRSIGLVATTSPGGARAAGKADWTPLAAPSRQAGSHPTRP